MSADHEFERGLRADLRSALDRVDGPHPEWATSPAAAIIATDPTPRSGAVPWRLLAVAVVLVIGSLVGAVLATQDTEERDAVVPGCPTLDDYAAALELPPMGEAPGVTFPPVAPTATMTTGLLQPGDWAVIANADGPGLQIRVRDIRECGRLPDLRSNHPGGSIYLATVDARVLRDHTRLHWLGVQHLLAGAVGESLGGLDPTPPLSVPGVDTRTSLDVPKGFAVSTTYVLDVPAVEKLITLDHPGGDAATTLPGLELTDLASARARWVVRDGDPTGGPSPLEPRPTPGATPTTGEVQLGEDVTMVTSGGPLVISLSDINSVSGYPGLLPTPGHGFVEVRVTNRDMGRSHASPDGWRAVGADGRELPIVQDELMPRLAVFSMWVVVEAPERGPIRLEYRHEGTADEMFWVQLRD